VIISGTHVVKECSSSVRSIWDHKTTQMCGQLKNTSGQRFKKFDNNFVLTKTRLSQVEQRLVKLNQGLKFDRYCPLVI